MNRPFEVYESKDKIARRRVLFALELLDAVTLERVSQGVKVKAPGLRGEPIINASGLFVWLDEDIRQLERISIDPRTLPYEEAEVNGDQLRLLREAVELKGAQRHTVELPPRVDYPFGTGITGLRGTLVEERARLEPVPKAEVYLRWLDQDDNWHDAPTRSHTTPARSDPPAKGGDFVAILRLAPSEVPQLDADGKLTVSLRVKRGADERDSTAQKVVQGKVANPSTPTQFVFAWDELEP
jgi:hypothetical protein